jgi:hypothetical protein
VGVLAAQDHGEYGDGGRGRRVEGAGRAVVVTCRGCAEKRSQNYLALGYFAAPLVRRQR